MAWPSHQAVIFPGASGKAALLGLRMAATSRHNHMSAIQRRLSLTILTRRSGEIGSQTWTWDMNPGVQTATICDMCETSKVIMIQWFDS
jgi:hypothetical protein